MFYIYLYIMFYIYLHNVLYLCTCVYRMLWLVCRLLLVASTVLAAKVRAVCVIMLIFDVNLEFICFKAR
jgi:hypothetical protein